MKHLVLIVVVVIALSGCAVSPSYEAPTSLSEANSATLYIYRTSVAFHSLNPERPYFYIDGKKVALLGTGDFVTTIIEPGDHVLSVKQPILFMPAFESDTLNFTAEAGKTYYIRYSNDFAGVEVTGNSAVVYGNSSLGMANEKMFELRQ